MSEDRMQNDVSQLAGEELPQAKFPGTRRRPFRVYFAEAVHAGIAAHAAEDTSVEIGGALVGLWRQDENGPFVDVSQFVRCDAAASKGGEVTFTHEAWNEINRQMDTRFAELKIVGWYHSHPGFGIFLSDRDRFIHQHFFANPGQIAYVVDPVAEYEGVFAWKGGQVVRWPHYWVGDEIRVASETAASGPAAAARPAALPPSAAGHHELGLLLAALRRTPVYVLVFLVGYLLASLWSSARDDWERQRLIEGVVGHYGVCKAIRPGLRENVAEVAASIQGVSAKVGTLAKEHVELAGDEAEAKKEAWAEIRDELAQAQRRLGEIARVYGLNERETAILERHLTELLTPAPERGPRGKASVSEK